MISYLPLRLKGHCSCSKCTCFNLIIMLLKHLHSACLLPSLCPSPFSFHVSDWPFRSLYLDLFSRKMTSADLGKDNVTTLKGRKPVLIFVTWE